MWLYHYFLQQAEGFHLYFSEYQLDITSNMAVGALWKWQKIELGYKNSISSPFWMLRRFASKGSQIKQMGYLREFFVFQIKTSWLMYTGRNLSVLISHEVLIWKTKNSLNISTFNFRPFCCRTSQHGERRRFDQINRKITRIILLKRLNFFW